MDDNQYKYRQSIDDWAEQWEKAQKAGVFKDAPKSSAGVVPQTASTSFFGATNTNPTDEVKDVDAKYWNQVSRMASGEPEPAMVTEAKISKAAIGAVVDKIASAPNPIPPWTVGPDNQPLPGETAPAYTEQDLAELADLHLKLGKLQDRVAAMGKKDKRLESQMEDLKNKIVVLSDALSNGFPLPKGAN